MPSDCALDPTAYRSICGPPRNRGCQPVYSSRVNWLSILMSRRIWTPGAGTIPTTTWETGGKANLLLAAAAAGVASASPSSGQDESSNSSIKQDAKEVGATIKRDTKQAVAVVKRD